MEATSRSSVGVIRETQPGVATGHPPIPVLTLEPGPNAISLNLKQLVRSRMLIQANSGGGKSHALRSLLELSHGHIQQFVIDPEGELSSSGENGLFRHFGDPETARSSSQQADICRWLANRISMWGNTAGGVAQCQNSPLAS